MTVLNDMWTLDEFQADQQEHLRRLKETGKAEVLTVESLAQADRGEGSPAEVVFERLAKKYGLEFTK